MKIPEYNEKELQIVNELPNPMGGTISELSYPVTPKEALRMTYQRKPVWEVLPIFDAETLMFNPAVIPDNVARAFVFDASFVPGITNQEGGRDMFGIDWEYVPSAGGSMVRPGTPFIEDANDLVEKIVWPDIDSWDWEGSRRSNEAFLKANEKKSVCTWFFNGYFERLISLMEFEGASIALVDEDQQDAVHAFFDKLTDLYIRIFEKLFDTFPEIDGIYFHDDWGSQRSSFFSPDVAEEMIVPYMRRFTDYIHSKGRFCHLHSCGHLMNQLENIIAAGWDAWDPQPMNDSQQLYEEYGDRILMGVIPTPFNPETASEEEQIRAAIEFADKFCRPEKPSLLNIYALAQYQLTTPVFKKALYEASRKNYYA